MGAFMIFLHTADLHIGSLRNAMKEDYLTRSRYMLEQIGTIAREQTDGILVIVGDVFDRKLVVNQERDLFLQWVLELGNDGVTSIVINGNHDITGPRKSNINWLWLLSQKKHNRLVVANCQRKLVTVNGQQFLLWPPVEKYDAKLTVKRIAKFVSAKKLADVIVVTHLRIAGSVGANGHTLDGVNGNTLGCAGVLYWALGDIHKQQAMGANAWYCGAPIQHKSNEPHPGSVLLVDTKHPTTPKVIEIKSDKLKEYTSTGGKEITPVQKELIPHPSADPYQEMYDRVKTKVEAADLGEGALTILRKSIQTIKEH